MRSYFGIHNHSEYSNIRLLDAINKPKDLVYTAARLGLSGICITDHECLSGHVKFNQLEKEIQKEYPNFTIGLGNEIYLTNDRSSGQKYYHFILIAKNEIGHKMLRELSSTAWHYSYVDRGLERVPTLKSELTEIVNKYGKGNLIATSACIGGELSSNALLYARAVAVGDKTNAAVYGKNIVEFLTYCQDLFGDDFYIECAPSDKSDQITVNTQLYKIASAYHIKMVVGTDAHYLEAKDRWVHKAYLNSKGGEREVDDFYEFAHLMNSDEVESLLNPCFPEGTVEWILDNTLEIQNKITSYSVFHTQDIPNVEVKDYPKNKVVNDIYPNLRRLCMSEDVHDRYWVNQCVIALNKIGKANDGRYWVELEEEARVKTIIGSKLHTNMFRYPNVLQHYIDLIWECGSMVGAGRGSSCAALNHFLMGITQLDPIIWKLPFFRYMNEERTELGDIDIDLCPSKRPLILQRIREERAHMFVSDLPQWAIDSLGCTLVATFGTEGTKSAILTACRGYRSDEFPDGIDVDEAQYMASLIPSERGFLWSISDVVNGNEEKDRRPVTAFISEISNYPGLLEIVEGIEGIINKRSSHASGVILYDGNPFDRCAFMKTPKGETITQFDLHDAEYMGNVKYDFLVTEVQDKLVQAIQLLQEDNQIEKDLNLREIYDKYFHPDVLPLDDDKIWDALDNVSIINTFQFDSQVGAQVAKKLKPRTVQEMSSANGLMRLMGEDGEERPIDKYARQKADISLWYKEMRAEGLTIEEQTTIEPYFKADYGVPPDQESLMLMLMDENICGFTLAERNAARKVVGKKQMNKIPELHEKILNQAKSEALGKYIWKHGVGPEMGYAFSRIHALAYSFIGVQTLYIATHWDPIYWDTACLIVNSGATDPDAGGQTDYSKMAKALGEILNANIKVSLVDINKSDFGFKPDVENHQILYGMKAMLNVGDDVINATIQNRPYASIKDYYLKVKPGKQAMISLIKGGAFDNLMDRKEAMIWYIWETCDKKKNLTLQNMGALIRYQLLPQDEESIMAKRVYEFNRYLKAINKGATIYELNDRCINFLTELGNDDLIIVQNNKMLIDLKTWDKIYQNWMDVIRAWISENKAEVLRNLNMTIFKEDWDKYAQGTLSAWEMEVLCFYYHEHELININNNLYGLSQFSNLPTNPVIATTKHFRGRDINLFQLSKIAGTCIAKNKTKSIVTLLTTDGVVNVKFSKEFFAMFDKQISEKQADGTKKVKEKSWFNRGSMIVVMGMRSEDDFISKKYSSSMGHQLYKIDSINQNGTISLRSERYAGVAEDDE